MCEASFMEIFLHRDIGHWKIINFSRKIVKSGWLILRVQFPQYSFWCKGEFSMRMAYVVFYLSSGSSRSCTCFVRHHGTEESVSKLHRWTRKHFKLLACWNFKINSILFISRAQWIGSSGFGQWCKFTFVIIILVQTAWLTNYLSGILLFTTQR